MANSRITEVVQNGAASSIGDDAVLADLASAASHYREARARSDAESANRATTLEQAQAAVAGAQAELAASRRELEQERLRGDRESVAAQEQRNEAERIRVLNLQLAETLKEIHRSVFDRNVFALILKACLSLTCATRGLYVTSRGGVMRIRASVGMPGEPKDPPSPYVEALCQKVIEERDSFVCNEGDTHGLPAPSSPDEQFRNCAVVPVVLLKNFDGIVIAADKESGEFCEADIDTVMTIGDQAAVAVENMRLERELQRAYLATVSTLADAVEAKDPYTHGHCEEVSRYARLIAKQLHLPNKMRSVVCYSALLHDVGKIGVSDGVLHKPGPLLPEEVELVRSHVRVGYDLLRKVPALADVASVVLHHHEWYDGSGYPDGLKGEDIPIAARIVAAVDAYCAMITRRSYKEAFTEEHARAELTRYSGKQFDPKVVDAFLIVLDLPEARDLDDDFDAECGVLPGFADISRIREALA